MKGSGWGTEGIPTHTRHNALTNLPSLSSDLKVWILTLTAESPQRSMAARPWLVMCCSNNVLNSRRPSGILEGTAGFMSTDVIRYSKNNMA